MALRFPIPLVAALAVLAGACAAPGPPESAARAVWSAASGQDFTGMGKVLSGDPLRTLLAYGDKQPAFANFCRAVRGIPDKTEKETLAFARSRYAADGNEVTLTIFVRYTADGREAVRLADWRLKLAEGGWKLVGF